MKISLFTRVLPTQIKSESGFVSAACEMCLTDDFDHVDGPDYSADGQWIWFNVEREGVVDIWRERCDGTDLERMTDR
jgi:Tol biopolymer transport system component